MARSLRVAEYIAPIYNNQFGKLNLQTDGWSCSTACNAYNTMFSAIYIMKLLPQEGTNFLTLLGFLALLGNADLNLAWTSVLDLW